MKITGKNLVFIMVDIQERFEAHIKDLEQVVKNSTLLNKTAEILEIPLVVTEQNPDGLGKTLSSIYIPEDHKLMSKTRFSIFDPDIETYIHSLHYPGLSFSGNLIGKPKRDVVLYGIEAHICIMQSVLEAVEKGYRPIVVADAVSSISLDNKEIALKRVIQSGGVVVSTEMLLFELLQGSYHPNFKKISNLIKESKK